MLYDMEERGLDVPSPSDIESVNVGAGEFTSIIVCDTIEYRKHFNSKAEKKTLTISAWLNTMAERESVNYSAVLQNALKVELHI